jgi:hypothetical protein
MSDGAPANDTTPPSNEELPLSPALDEPDYRGVPLVCGTDVCEENEKLASELPNACSMAHVSSIAARRERWSALVPARAASTQASHQSPGQLTRSCEPPNFSSLQRAVRPLRRALRAPPAGGTSSRVTGSTSTTRSAAARTALAASFTFMRRDRTWRISCSTSLLAMPSSFP